ncbi:MAG: radical SAM protein [Candidatus Omnitrophota bacterium]
MAEPKYIFGPVFSWRLGVSLGIDPISQAGKVCTFDCVYCQLGETKTFSDKRKVFVPTKEILAELRSAPKRKIDYITFSSSGEPTLAANLGEIIREIRKIRKEKIAVITNSSLIDREDARRDLALADFVLVKLDAHNEGLFRDINRPMPGVRFSGIINGIKEFRAFYKGRLALQVMFVGKNKDSAAEIAGFAKKLGIGEVQINTPLRECGERPLSKEEIKEIKKYFKGMTAVSVYDVRKKKVRALDDNGLKKRHGSDKR